MSSNRPSIPSTATLGLSSPKASEDISWLGWNKPEHTALLWCLAAASDQDLALNTLMRMAGNLDDDGAELTTQLCEDEALRVRFFALLGGSTLLGDHMAAHPETWKELLKPLPEKSEMFQQMLQAVGAQVADFADPDADSDSGPGTTAGAGSNTGSGAEPDNDDAPDPASSDLSTPGTYRAAMTGSDATCALRDAYRTLMLRIAAHDLAGSYFARKGQTEPQPKLLFSTITGALSDLADAALTAALAVAVAEVYGPCVGGATESGAVTTKSTTKNTTKNKPPKPVDARLAVIAMGKCGAQELNYISDVDVIFVAEPASNKATRLAAEFNRIGSAAFFEVDPNLRPEGKSGALVRTLESHIKYYRRWAETWEFQALLKARAQTGYLPLGHRYEDAIRPMVWTASERDSFVEDVQAMRRRVLANVPKDMRTRELKLGTGGMRDVEFAVQLLQLVHGRSDERLRVLSTVEALEALKSSGYIGREDSWQLIEAYEFLRLLEHRLQLQRFRRTHTMPADDDTDALRWLARAAGFDAHGSKSSYDLMVNHLRKVRVRISELHSRLFYRPLLDAVASMSAEELKLSPAAAKLQLSALGYRHPGRAFDHLTKLASGTSRKARIQSILLPGLMEWLANTADPDAGLLNYRKLSDAAFDRSWFLRMLRDEGIVGKRLMSILGNSPYTAELIINAPDTVKLLSDGANGPKFLETNPQQVSKSLVNSSKRHADPDKAVAVARSLRRVELARIASADQLGFMPVERVCRELSLIWDAVLEAAIRAEVRASLRELDREEPPARIAVIGMGRLGGQELGFGSDADVLMVAEPAEGEDETEAMNWAKKIVDKLRARLAKPSGDPPLEVDLGLRPEGRSGAVVRSIASYRRYYSQWGEAWEIQALLRANVVAGDAEVGAAFIEMINDFRYPASGISESTIREIRRIKARVDNERLPRGADRNTHTKLGRGGLTDVEWTVQLLIMMHAAQHHELRTPSTLDALDALRDCEILTDNEAEQLREAWLMATNARNALVLVRGKRVDQLPQPGNHLAQVAGVAGWAPEDNQEFLEAYLKATRHARRVVDQVFWGEPDSYEYD